MKDAMQTRRSFIKTAGFALGGLTLSAVSGCAPSKHEKNDQATSVSDIKWDEEHDIIIVGGGLAGFASAVTVAREGNGAHCLLLEKGAMETGSGNSAFAAGMVLWTKEKNKFFSYLKELRAEMDNTPDEVLEAYAEGVSENLDWLKGLPGYKDDEVTITEHYEVGSGSSCYPEYNELPDAYSLGNISWKATNDSGNTQVTGFMYNVMNSYKDAIEHKTNAPVTALVQDPESKTILGVIYTSGSHSIYAKATKGVIMCCGGFENNPQMKADYLSSPWARRIAGAGNEGDGITMCARAGASMWHMNSCAGFWTSMSKIDSDVCLMRTPKEQGITVGVNGRRFFMDWDTDVAEDWGSFDEGDLKTHVGSRHGHMQFGGEWPHMPMPSKLWFIVDSAGYQTILSNKAMAIDFDPMDGWGYSAPTLEELAAKIEVPPHELIRSVSQWNECCVAGEDIYFHRPKSTLNALTSAPYYALFCAPTMLNTDGGPRRSPLGEVIDLDGKPLPHLYSAGEFGSVWSNMYNGGGNLAECLAFGRISVRNCLGITA